jgi:hypothetical protein
MAFCMNFKTLPRCGARARSNGGSPCRQAAIQRSGRCHYHGGKSKVKHGRHTKSSLQQKKQYQSMVRDARSMIKQVKDTLFGKNRSQAL